MATRKTQTEVATTEDDNTALTTMGIDIGADGGSGMEGTDSESFAIPFLRVLQKNSPQVEEGDASYVPGAKPGMFFNSVTGELFDGGTGVRFVPAAYQRRFIKWAPRGAKQGFLGEYTPEDVAAMRERGEIAEERGKLLVPTNDGEVDAEQCERFVDTRSHFGLALSEDGTPSQVLLPLTSTQIKKSKKMLAALQQMKVKAANGKLVTPPTWYNVVRLKTARESNDQGSWYGVTITMEGTLNDLEHGADLYAAGKAFHDAILGGAVGADYSEPAEEGAAEDGKF